MNPARESLGGEPRPAEGTPLYVHLPLCAAKCPYCDFYSVPAGDWDRGAVLAAVLGEAELRAPRAPRTVYIGGGTPSLFSADELRGLLEGLERACGFRSSASEVTVECNPESLDEGKAAALLGGGTTRLSIGFQSLQDDVLERFERVHRAAECLRAFGDARRAGVERISLDLIYGAPGQRREVWERDLSRVLELGPEHLSAYCLTYEEGTPFHRRRRAGELVPASEAQELELFEVTHRICEQAGYRPYEVSNFSLSGEECIHNINYWHNGPYVGIGPSAVTHLGFQRWGNVSELGAYLGGRGGEVVAWREELTPRARLGETWWLGLRLLAGIDPARARETAGLPPEDGDPALPVAERLGELGLLEREGPRYRLSRRGLPLADAVAREFLSASAE